ncbi:hypothetical protein [uncultured Arcticibacterium sp.]|uniref:hypothetical protein n=1 Tax=uncultured Arcticibacterium sp. TaxID=2173042 RepID=UPI0030F7FB5D
MKLKALSCIVVMSHLLINSHVTAQNTAPFSSSINFVKKYTINSVSGVKSKRLYYREDFILSIDTYFTATTVNLKNRELNLNYGLNIGRFGGFNNKSINERGNSGWLLNPSINLNYNLIKRERFISNILLNINFLINQKALNKVSEFEKYRFVNSSMGLLLSLPRRSNTIALKIENAINVFSVLHIDNPSISRKNYWTSIGLNYYWNKRKNRTKKVK